MPSCTLTVFGSGGQAIAHQAVAWPQAPGAADFASLTQRVVAQTDYRFATLREGRRARGLFLANDLVPDRTVRLPQATRVRGQWVTGAATLGSWGGGRVYVGPTVFFRQLDLVPREAWMAPLLVGLPQAAGTCAIGKGEAELFEVLLGETRCLYAPSGSRWEFYGAGNTPTQLVDDVVGAAHPANAKDWAWLLGAVPLAPASL